MARATNDAFLTSMTKMMASAKEKGTGAVSITLKRFVPKPEKKGNDPSIQAPVCLLRAKRGKRKATTVVDSKNAAKFQRSFGVILTVQTNDFKAADKKKKDTKKRPEAKGEGKVAEQPKAAAAEPKGEATKEQAKTKTEGKKSKGEKTGKAQ